MSQRKVTFHKRRPTELKGSIATKEAEELKDPKTSQAVKELKDSKESKNPYQDPYRKAIGKLMLMAVNLSQYYEQVHAGRGDHNSQVKDLEETLTDLFNVDKNPDAAKALEKCFAKILELIVVQVFKFDFSDRTYKDPKTGKAVDPLELLKNGHLLIQTGISHVKLITPLSKLKPEDGHLFRNGIIEIFDSAAILSSNLKLNTPVLSGLSAQMLEIQSFIEPNKITLKFPLRDLEKSDETEMQRDIDSVKKLLGDKEAVEVMLKNFQQYVSQHPHSNRSDVILEPPAFAFLKDVNDQLNNIYTRMIDEKDRVIDQAEVVKFVLHSLMIAYKASVIPEDVLGLQDEGQEENNAHVKACLHVMLKGLEDKLTKKPMQTQVRQSEVKEKPVAVEQGEVKKPSSAEAENVAEVAAQNVLNVLRIEIVNLRDSYTPVSKLFHRDSHGEDIKALHDNVEKILVKSDLSEQEKLKLVLDQVLLDAVMALFEIKKADAETMIAGTGKNKLTIEKINAAALKLGPGHQFTKGLIEILSDSVMMIEGLKLDRTAALTSVLPIIRNISAPQLTNHPLAKLVTDKGIILNVENSGKLCEKFLLNEKLVMKAGLQDIYHEVLLAYKGKVDDEVLAKTIIGAIESAKKKIVDQDKEKKDADVRPELIELNKLTRVIISSTDEREKEGARATHGKKG